MNSAAAGVEDVAELGRERQRLVERGPRALDLVVLPGRNAQVVRRVRHEHRVVERPAQRERLLVRGQRAQVVAPGRVDVGEIVELPRDRRRVTRFACDRESLLAQLPRRARDRRAAARSSRAPRGRTRSLASARACETAEGPPRGTGSPPSGRPVPPPGAPTTRARSRARPARRRPTARALGRATASPPTRGRACARSGRATDTILRASSTLPLARYQSSVVLNVVELDLETLEPGALTRSFELALGRPARARGSAPRDDREGRRGGRRVAGARRRPPGRSRASTIARRRRRRRCGRGSTQRGPRDRGRSPGLARETARTSSSVLPPANTPSASCSSFWQSLRRL